MHIVPANSILFPPALFLRLSLSNWFPAFDFHPPIPEKIQIFRTQSLSQAPSLPPPPNSCDISRSEFYFSA